MIDGSDADTLWLASFLTPGGAGVLLFLIAIAVAYVACQNNDECAQKHCDTGKPVLTHHQCVCETLAK